MSVSSIIRIALLGVAVSLPGAALAQENPLWQVYENTLKSAKYIDLTHAFERYSRCGRVLPTPSSNQASPVRTSKAM